MATTISTGNSDNDTITGVRIDIARLEGMLTAFLTDGVRRIDNNEKNVERLRTDLDASKLEAKRDVNDLQNILNAMALKSTEDGNKILHGLNEAITTNKNNIAELRSDVIEVKDKQNGGYTRIVMILSPILAFVALLWNILGK